MLNELLEDYQEYNEDEAYDEFINLLWRSKYGIRTYKKTYTFKLQPESLGNNELLIELFKPYQKIEIRYAKSYYNDSPSSIDMIRIHINNMYLYLTNKEVYLSKAYIDELLRPRNLYFDIIKRIKNNEQIDVIEIQNIIELSKCNAEKIKSEDVAKKIELSFSEYKKLINEYILRLFNNYKPPHEYEVEHGWNLNVNHDAWHEDNYIVKYFCKSLTGYMQNYLKQINIKERYCKNCNIILQNNTKSEYCKKCYKDYRRSYKTIKQRYYRDSVDS